MVKGWRWMAVCACTIVLLLTAHWGSAGGDATIPDGRITGGASQGYFANLTAAQGIRLGDLVQIVRGETVAATALVSRVSDHDCTLLIVDPVGATLRIGDMVRFLKHRNVSPPKPPPAAPSPSSSTSSSPTPSPFSGSPSPQQAGTPAQPALASQSGVEIAAMKMEAAAYTPPGSGAYGSQGNASPMTLVKATVSLRNASASAASVMVIIDLVTQEQSSLGPAGTHLSMMAGSASLGPKARQDLVVSGQVDFAFVSVRPETNSFTVSVLDVNKGVPFPVNLALKPSLSIR